MRYLIVAAILLLGACSNDANEATQAPATEPTVTERANSNATATRQVELAGLATAEAQLTEAAAPSGATHTTAPTTTTAPTRAPEPTATTAAEPTATEIPATPTPSALGIGGTAHWENGVTVTLYTAERPVPPENDFSQPEAGFEFLSIEVEQCAGPNVPTGQVLTANSFAFTVVMDDNTRYDPSFGSAKAPDFSLTDLQANDCVRGWIDYELPQGLGAKEVQFSYSDWEFEKMITKFDISP